MIILQTISPASFIQHSREKKFETLLGPIFFTSCFRINFGNSWSDFLFTSCFGKPWKFLVRFFILQLLCVGGIIGNSWSDFFIRLVLSVFFFFGNVQAEHKLLWLFF